MLPLWPEAALHGMILAEVWRIVHPFRSSVDGVE
jgi:hypothetical protein